VVRSGIDARPIFSPDGKSVAFDSGGGIHDWLVERLLHVVTIADRSIRNVARDHGRIPEEIFWSPDSRSLWFAGPWDITSQIFRVGADGIGYSNVSKCDCVISDSDVDAAAGRAVFVHQTLTSPPEIYIGDLSKFAPRRLTLHAASYRDKQIGETRVLRWRNPKDGVEIEGLLTLPIGYEAGKRYPLLTFVHGGPASRFDKEFLGYLGFIHPVHVYAARGFAVLRPNPRGSGGYGETFRMANRNDWGGMDWIDVNAGIDSVIAQGIADPKRMGFMGWSYGGFLAAWAVGSSDRFQAISIGAPIVDLLSFHGTTDIRDYLPHYFPEESSLQEMRHAPLSLEKLRAHSPLWNLKKTPAHVLIQHVEGDDRVPFSQGLMLYRVLDELGVDVTMVAYPGSGHTPREPRRRIDAGQRNVEFFTRYVMTPEPSSQAR
jgi:dipeptidyl aminopeptidase/acylaminoacyl peptidase